MTITMDRSGRIVIPKKLREEAGLSPGTPLEIDGDENGIQIKAKPTEWEIVKDGPFYIAKSKSKGGPPLTNEMVNRVLDEIRFRNMPKPEDFRTDSDE